jgi:hypothetical protein
MNIKIVIIFIVAIAVMLIFAKTMSKDIPIETGILGTMYTFFYGLFINAIFKFLDEKFINVRQLLGELIGKSQSLFNVVLLTKNKKVIKNTRKDLAAFLESFNTLKPEKYYQNQEHINKLYYNLKDLKIKTPKDAQEYSRIIQFIDHLSVTREKLEIFGKKHLKGETKFILICTSILYLVLIAVMTFTSLNIYINIVGLLLIFMVFFVILLMFNLDNLSYGTYYIKYKNIDEIVDEINHEK